MKNLTTVSRLACLTIVLAAGTMMATATSPLPKTTTIKATTSRIMAISTAR